ncbi:CAP domain-containing protein [Streptomyces sp. MAR4 CNX-425]|uniref:CAP domain-containing protein n=1 Tax=Streptomyces sp. MAR4 CNX-425 TaxID=3406343 RepID=UPI003B501E4A
MGRHRRSQPQPQPAAVRRRDAPGAYGGDEVYGTGRPRGQHRKQSPARAGMLGTSAALAVGAVAMASGVLGNGFDLDRGTGGPAGHVEAGDPPSPSTQGGSELPTLEASPSASGGSDRPESPTPDGKKAAGKDGGKDADGRESKSASPSTTAPEREPSKSAEPSSASPDPSRTESESPTPTRTETSEPTRSSKPPATADAATAAEAEVLRLVNQERAQAGCRPLTNDPELAKLAGDYSQDMAERGFFDHTDPDGDDPWDRAQEYGISDLGGENIARGQADARAVMDAWMNSEGHRANILNCDFRTLGVGAHFAGGGPWWTQNFGF